MIHTVVSVDGSACLDWGARLLADTHSEVGQQGPFTRIWSADIPPTPFPKQTFVTPGYAAAVQGDWYPPYNRLYGILEWCRAGAHEGDAVLILDPDMAFVAPFTIEMIPGTFTGTIWDFLKNDLGGVVPQNSPFVRRHCCRPDLVSQAGNPWLFHMNDLAELHERAIDKTAQIRRDASAISSPWVAEMWAVVFSAAEMGLSAVYADLVADVHPHNSKPVLQPLLHWAWPLASTRGDGWTWSKLDFVPGDRIPPCDTVAVDSIQTFSKLLANHFGPI